MAPAAWRLFLTPLVALAFTGTPALWAGVPLSQCAVLLSQRLKASAPGLTQSSEIQVEVSAHAASLGIYIHSPDPLVEYLVEELIAPDGEKLLGPTHSFPSLTSLVVPVVRAGSWRFKIRGIRWEGAGLPTPAWGTPGPQLLVVEKTVGNRNARLNPQRGKVRISLFAAESSSVTKSKAHEEKVRAGLAGMIEIFKDAGIQIELTSSKFHPAPRTEQSAQALVLGSTQVQSILKGLKTKSLAPHSVPMIWTGSLQDTDTQAFGFATAIGGPIGQRYPFRGGVFISEKALQTDRMHLDILFAHELAHYLGLVHPFDPAVGFEDALTDTRSEGDFNLMETAAAQYAEPTARRLTPQQIEVLLRNPFVELAPSSSGETKAVSP